LVQNAIAAKRESTVSVANRAFASRIAEFAIVNDTISAKSRRGETGVSALVSIRIKHGGKGLTKGMKNRYLNVGHRCLFVAV